MPSATSTDAVVKSTLRPSPQPGPQELFFRTPADIAVIGGAVHGGKALALTTPIPTPSGWTTMGALEVGDRVFDERGRPTTVVYVTPPYEPKALYDVRFSDDCVIRADGEHLWYTTTVASRVSEQRAARRAMAFAESGEREPSPFAWDQSHKRIRPGVVTTEEIRASLLVRGTTANHAVSCCEEDDDEAELEQLYAHARERKHTCESIR